MNKLWTITVTLDQVHAVEEAIANAGVDVVDFDKSKVFRFNNPLVKDPIGLICYHVVCDDLCFSKIEKAVNGMRLY